MHPTGLSSFETFLDSGRGRRLVRDVSRIAGHNDGDDVVQDVLLWAWQRWDRFQNEDHVVYACIRFAQNRIRDRARCADSRKVERRAGFDAHALGVAADPADAVVRLDECRDRWQAFRRLPVVSRDLLLGRAEGASYDELGDRFATTAERARAQVFRSRAVMRRAMRPSAMPTALLLPRRVAASIRRLVRQGVRGTGRAGGLGTGLASAVAVSLMPALGPVAVAVDATPRPARPATRTVVEVTATRPAGQRPPAGVASPVRRPAGDVAALDRGERHSAVNEVATTARTVLADLERCYRTLVAAQNPETAEGYGAYTVDVPALRIDVVERGADVFYDERYSVSARLPDYCPAGLTTRLWIRDESPGAREYGPAPLVAAGRRSAGIDALEQVHYFGGLGFVPRTVSRVSVHAEAVHGVLGMYFCRVYEYAIVATPDGAQMTPPVATGCRVTVDTSG